MSEEQLPDHTDAMPTDDMREQRLRKMKKIADAGGRPYGRRVDGIIPCLEAKQRFADAPAETEVAARIAGRIIARRVMGKSMFANIQDQDGQMQLYIQKNVIGDEAYEFFFKDLDIGDIITAAGTVFVTRTGEVSLRTTSFGCSPSLRPLPEKWHGLTDMEQRYRQLSRPDQQQDVRKTFQQRSASSRIRNYLDSKASWKSKPR